MANMEYLKDMPIAVLGGGAVGKSCAADMKLAGKEVQEHACQPGEDRHPAGRRPA